MPEKEKKVSVVICTYNGSSYLKKQLDSILNQTYDIEEIVIVDDCSTDSTREVLKEYQSKNRSIKIFLNDENLGSNKAFKYAISLATNEYIALCDQDDIWYDNKIEIQMNSITKSGFDLDKKPLVVFHDLCLMDNEENITNASFWKLHKFNPYTFNFRKLLIFNIVTGCTCIINSDMRDELIKSDMKDIIMHDYLIALIGYGFGNPIYIDQPLMYYRSHSSSVTFKERASFIGRIKGFISRIKNKNYLVPNILQIKQFDNLYHDKIDVKKKKLVEKMIGLERKSLFNRFVYKWLSN